MKSSRPKFVYLPSLFHGLSHFSIYILGTFLYFNIIALYWINLKDHMLSKFNLHSQAVMWLFFAKKIFGVPLSLESVILGFRSSLSLLFAEHHWANYIFFLGSSCLSYKLEIRILTSWIWNRNI